MGRAARPSPGQKNAKTVHGRAQYFQMKNHFVHFRFMMCTFREFEVNLSVELFL